jgi:hypothetical protein
VPQGESSGLDFDENSFSPSPRNDFEDAKRKLYQKLEESFVSEKSPRNKGVLPKSPRRASHIRTDNNRTNLNNSFQVNSGTKLEIDSNFVNETILDK